MSDSALARRFGERSGIIPKKQTRNRVNRAPRHCVYVIELDKAVLLDPKFARKNPDYRPGKPCVYVGMTGLTPEIRFEQHRVGIKACKYVKRHGKRLRPKLYLRYNPLSYEAAALREKALATRLRKKGYAVWQA